MITRITSKDNPALKHFRQLQVRKYRQRYGEFVLEGPVVIREALEQGTRMSMALCTDDFRETKEGRALIRQVEEEGVPLYCTEEGLFASAAGTQTPQGILATARIPVWDRELLEEPGACFLVLDRVQDPGNIGTMVRTAEAAGFRGIIAVKGTADLYSGKVSRAAVGGLLRLPVFYCDSGEALLEELKPLGKKILCTDPRSNLAYYDAPMAEDIALVIGNEAGGISPELLEGADLSVGIPMEGRTESLNAAVSAGILMYESLRQRRIR